MKTRDENAAAAPAEDPEHIQPPPEDEVEPDADHAAVTEPDPPEPLLTVEEMDRIRQEARKKVEAELAERRKDEKKQAMAAALDAETLAQRREAGLTDYRDDIVEVLIDVAPFAEGITIDGATYQHGQWYKMPRRKADCVREMMARSWDAEDRAGNPNKRHPRRVNARINSMGREMRTDDGTLTLGLDPRVHGQSGLVSGIREVA